MVNIQIQTIREGIELPSYAHKTDAGMDVRAAVDVIILPGQTVVIPTGISMAIPEGYEVQVRPRSGCAAKTKLRVAFGTIDSGYRGEIGVIVDNISRDYVWNYDHTISVLPPTQVFDINGKSVGSRIPNDPLTKDGYYEIKKGDRIAQLVLSHVNRVDSWARCNDVSKIEGDSRGTGGYGSSGTN